MSNDQNFKNKAVVTVFDCPFCKAKDLPASHSGPLVKRIKNRYKEVHIWSCPNCQKVLNLGKDFKPKKWATAEELRAMGWRKEK